ncbi:MAG: RNA pseudouridine synthase [Lentisphaeria bacterium]|nr:RNA pseudouridine synthase [Lentisphaeria bacterium]
MEPLYLDNHLLVLDKPWGLLTQPSGTAEPSLEESGKAFIKERFSKPGAVFLEAVHRIDRVVGGAVLFARTSKALQRLNALQRDKGIGKIYRALVEGIPSHTEATLEDFILHDDFRARIVPRSVENAKPCRLSYRTLEIRDGKALLEIKLETGRYHQIRAQLSHAGLPICGDLKYGASRDSLANAPDGGIALLSYSLEFPHPVSKEIIKVHSNMQL